METILKELSDGINRSETSRLRDVFEQIEHALKAGVSRSVVLNALRLQGFKMTIRSFESALYRIRKAHRAVQNPKGKVMKIAGFEVSTPDRFTHNPKLENDLLK